MQKILCLPKISIKDLEEKVKQRRTTHKKYNYQEQYTERQHSHNNDIKITSPFYQKCTAHKGKCQCQYHRLKKDANNIRPIIKNKQDSVYISFGKTLNLNQQHKLSHMKLRIDNNHISKLHIHSPPKLLEPLPNIDNIRPTIEEDDPIESRLSSSITLQQKSIPKLPTRKAFKSIKTKLVLQVSNEEANSRIDALNREYIELVSQRLKNEKFKQKYLKTLFGFIKMKSNQNKFYMYNSKAYIKNSLNVLLNHFTMEKLLNTEELTQEEILQIAYYMNCFPQKVKDIVLDLKRVVSEMERVLAQIRANRKINEEKQNQNNIYPFNSFFNSQNSPHQVSPSDLQNKITDQNIQTKKSLFSEINLNNPSAIRENVHFMPDLNMAQPDLTKNLKKDKNSILRTSSRKMNQLRCISPSKIFSQNKQDNEEINRKSTLSTNKNIQALNRSLRSTVLGTVDQVEKQAYISRKKITTKLKKTKLKSKYTSLEWDQKYSNIYYDKYLTKGGFKNLISEIQRLDQNDEQRGKTLYKQLNAEKYLNDEGTIDDLIKTFSPLFNQKSLQSFIKHIVFVKDQRYIQQLQKQLDDMINQIKKNDPRQQAFDFFQTKAHKHIPLAMNQISKCRQFKIQKAEEINHIKYFEAEEQIERHKHKQQSVKLHLEQIELRDINFDIIDPTLTAAITHFSSPNKKLSRQREANLPDISEQKKILLYMKKNHQGTFNYLANEFTSICRSLPKEDTENA